MEACLLLAQDAFQVVLDSENPNGKKEIYQRLFFSEQILAIGKMRANPTAQLKGFADHYEKCIQSTVHYERLMPETDQDKR
jgi:septal ring factor EnvC (AmiA/AmiB activator)